MTVQMPTPTLLSSLPHALTHRARAPRLKIMRSQSCVSRWAHRRTGRGGSNTALQRVQKRNNCQKKRNNTRKFSKLLLCLSNDPPPRFYSTVRVACHSIPARCLWTSLVSGAISHRYSQITSPSQTLSRRGPSEIF